MRKPVVFTSATKAQPTLRPRSPPTAEFPTVLRCDNIGNPRISAGGTPEKTVWVGCCSLGWGFSWSLWEQYVHKTMNMEKLLWKMLDGIWWNKYGTWVSKHLNILKSHGQHGKEWHGHYHKEEDEKNLLMVLWRWSHFACMLELFWVVGNWWIFKDFHGPFQVDKEGW